VQCRANRRPRIVLSLLRSAPNLAAMKATPESFAAMLDEARIDSESFTYVVVAGGTRGSVASALGIDLELSPILPSWTQWISPPTPSLRWLGES
jgi:hypothetical protein